MKKFYNKYKVGINAFLVGVLLNVISSIIYAKIENIDFISSIFEIWKMFYGFIINILEYKVSIWIILVTIFVIYLALRIYFSIIEKKEANKPDFLNYLNDVYKGIDYRWEIDLYNKRLKNVHPICSCGAQLTTKNKYKNRYYSSPKLYCVNCDKIIEEDFDNTILEDAILYFTNKYNNKVREYHKNKESH